MLAPVPPLEVVNDAGLKENCEHFVRTPYYEVGVRSNVWRSATVDMCLTALPPFPPQRLLSAFILPAPVDPKDAVAQENGSSDGDMDAEDAVFVGEVSVGERCHAELVANGLIEEDPENDWLEQEIYQFTCGDDNEISRILQSHVRATQHCLLRQLVFCFALGSIACSAD